MGVDPGQIKKQYNKTQYQLNKSLKIIEDKLHKNFADCDITTNMKGLDSLIRKCDTKECKDILELSDLIRGRLFFPKQYTYKEICQKLVDVFGNDIKKIDWVKERDFGLKYGGIIHVDINVDGVNFELQVMPKRFAKYTETLHKVYELLRDNNHLPNDKKKRIIDLHNKLYKTLINNQ